MWRTNRMHVAYCWIDPAADDDHSIRRNTLCCCLTNIYTPIDPLEAPLFHRRPCALIFSVSVLFLSCWMICFTSSSQAWRRGRVGEGLALKHLSRRWSGFEVNYQLSKTYPKLGKGRGNFVEFWIGVIIAIDWSARQIVAICFFLEWFLKPISRDSKTKVSSYFFRDILGSRSYLVRQDHFCGAM